MLFNNISIDEVLADDLGLDQNIENKEYLDKSSLHTCIKIFT